MRDQRRGTFVFLLVSGIAMVMLLSFGLFASYTADHCTVAIVKSEYAQTIHSAKVFAAH